MHYLEIVIGNELIDIIPFCSDWCHKSYCSMHGIKYEGWNGCHELEQNGTCADCGAVIEGTNNDSANL